MKILFSYRDDLSKILAISSLLLPSLTLAGEAELKANVDNYIQQQVNMLKLIRDDATLASNGKMKTGDSGELKADPGLNHMIEVGELIIAGELDACCWNPVPVRYDYYINLKTRDILDGNSVTDPDRPTQDYTPSVDFSRKMNDYLQPSLFFEVIDIGAELAGDAYKKQSYDFYKALNFDQTTGAAGGGDALIFNLDWVHSYKAPKYVDAGFHPEFTDHYVWSCVVCLGAGFYDLAGMFDTDMQPTPAYYTIVALLSQESQDWLNQQNPEGFGAVPLQTSIGPTFETMPDSGESLQGQRRAVDTYPTHCHAATELYMTIDPIDMSKSSDTDPLQGQFGYNIPDEPNNPVYNTYGTRSFFAANPNDKGVEIVFGDMDAMGQLAAAPVTPYQDFESGDLAYNASVRKHSMHPGTTYQAAAWARLNRPYEGTFFPNDGDGGLDLPSEDGDCVGKSGDEAPGFDMKKHKKMLEKKAKQAMKNK